MRDVNPKALKEVLGKLKLDKKTLFEESFGHDPPGYDLILKSYVYNFQASIIFVISVTLSTEILKYTQLSLVLGKLNFFIVSYIHGHTHKESDSFAERVEF